MGTTQPPRTSRSPPDSGAFGSPPPSLPPSSSSFNARYSTSPAAERRSLEKAAGFDPSPNALDAQAYHLSTLLLRRLPAKMSSDALNSMFLFAEDFQDSRFVDIPDEQGFLCAIARFRTVEGAHEVRDRLHGKPNSTGEAAMIVELLQTGGQAQSKPPSSDGTGLSRQISNAASSRGSPVGRQTSRYFQSMSEKVAPIALPPSVQNGDDMAAQSHSFYSPRSPQGTSFAHVTGKSMISEDDDETGELLKDPVAYAKSNHPGPVRRTNSSTRAPTLRLANLSLNTATGNVPNGTNLTSPTSAAGFMHSRQGPASPVSELSPNMVNGVGPMSPTSATGYPMSPTQMQQRHHYPPANPADQNPPCNTLYVGNLPVDTSEDELKAVFSKQRGYKRLCFRTKHNGPMCFVEFEDVSFATKALNELYGHPLHNSVKGGIRLSFSKNPLGVRTGQNNPMNLNSPVGGSGAMGLGGLGGPSFSTASGPPPGLAMPPGLGSPGLSSNAGGGGSFFSPASPPGVGPVGQRSHAGSYLGGGLGAANSGFNDGMMGR